MKCQLSIRNISQCPFGLMPIHLFSISRIAFPRGSPPCAAVQVVGPVRRANADLALENNSIAVGSVLQSIVFVMIIEPFRVRCYQQTEHIAQWTN